LFSGIPQWRIASNRFISLLFLIYPEMQPSAGILAINGLAAMYAYWTQTFSKSCTTPFLNQWNRSFVCELYVDGGTRNREARTL